MSLRKKLIEVALPLEAINRESAREKSIRQGHPSTLHLWWARRPLAACRAVLFASIVDDPSSRSEEFPTEEAQNTERERLFRIIEELVKWENSDNKNVLELAREEIRKATGGKPPPVLDPFCGGGSIPLEAQRLGLEAHASDLNPVAVLITKTLVEIPSRFAGQPPINPEVRDRLAHKGGWQGARGLAEDVRYYGQWMREEALQRIGHLYPRVRLPSEYGSGEATVIAWLWARTVTCPNPVCGAQMPLVRSFWLSTNPRSKVWVEPIIDQGAKSIRFEIRTGDGAPPEPPKVGRGAKFKCLVCGQIAGDQHVKGEGMAKRMGAQLMAVVAEGNGKRVYLPADDYQEETAKKASPAWAPEEELPYEPRAIWCTLYGLTTYRDLFTPRQLVAMTTFSGLVEEAHEQALKDAVAAGLSEDGQSLESGGTGASAYADAIATLAACCVSAIADDLSSIVTWRSGHGTGATRSTFARQGLPMAWDFAEANPFGGAAGDLGLASLAVAQAMRLTPGTPPGKARQLDAVVAVDGVVQPLICTDPPYYDNIGYADLADFFYVWLRRSLAGVYPDLFSTLLTPKEAELVATPYRFGGDRRKAERFFEEGLRESFRRMRERHNPDFPLTLFYAFKQAESVRADEDIATVLTSTGWETMLEGLLGSGFAVTGTWPMRTERGARSVGIGTNALASSIVLVCRPRAVDAPIATRQEFLRALRTELPAALKKLQLGNIAPVDLAQASIGPGMAVFSQYAKVVEADGTPMRVGTALGIINQVLSEVLAEQEEEYDSQTRWAVAWFEQHGMGEGKYGDAEILSKAKATALEPMTKDGFLKAKAGRVALVPRAELPEGWNPATDLRLTVWEVTQYLIRALETSGEQAAAELLRRVGALGEIARDLAYRLYVVCERKKWAEEALAFNSLVVAWPEIARLAAETPGPEQQELG